MATNGAENGHCCSVEGENARDDECDAQKAEGSQVCVALAEVWCQADEAPESEAARDVQEAAGRGQGNLALLDGFGERHYEVGC